MQLISLLHLLQILLGRSRARRLHKLDRVYWRAVRVHALMLLGRLRFIGYLDVESQEGAGEEGGGEGHGVCGFVS